jgi:hypothetical protein
MSVRTSAIIMACMAWLVMVGVSHAQGTGQHSTYAVCMNQAAARGISGDALRAFIDACTTQNSAGPRESPSGGLLGPCTGEYCGGVTGRVIPLEEAHRQCWLQSMGDPTGTPASRLTPFDVCMYHRGWNFYP